MAISKRWILIPMKKTVQHIKNLSGTSNDTAPLICVQKQSMVLSWMIQQCSCLDLQLTYAWIKSTSFRCTAFVVVFVKMSAGGISVGTQWTLIRPLSMSSVQNHLRSCRCLVLAEYPFVETTESAPVESFPMLIFSNPLNLSSRSRSWMWQASFIQRVVATSSLSTVLKAVSAWSDETHEMGVPEKRKM